MIPNKWKALILLGLGLLLTTESIFSQDKEKKLGWFFETGVSGQWNGGNSQSSTLSLGMDLTRVWHRAKLRFETLGTTTKSSLTSRTAIGTTEMFELREITKTEKTAELYYARVRLDYDMSNRFYALGGIDWLRNIFAGIDSRVLIGMGLGNTWANSKKLRFKTNYSMTYTFQNDVVQNPFLKTDFPGIRFEYDFWKQVTESTEFKSTLVVDWNLDHRSDIRMDFYCALPVSISKKLALKPSLRLLWRNAPSLVEVELFDSSGSPTGDKVVVPLGKMDSILSLTLVVKI